MLMGILEGLGRLAGDADRVLHRELALPLKPVAQRFTFDEGHGEPEVTGGVPGVENSQDVGVLQAGGGLDFSLKAAWTQREGQLRTQHLERDRALMPEVGRQEDGRHPAPAQLAVEAVAVCESKTQLGQEIGHTRSGLGYPHVSAGRWPRLEPGRGSLVPIHGLFTCPLALLGVLFLAP